MANHQKTALQCTPDAAEQHASRRDGSTVYLERMTFQLRALAASLCGDEGRSNLLSLSGELQDGLIWLLQARAELVHALGGCVHCVGDSITINCLNEATLQLWSLASSLCGDGMELFRSHSPDTQEGLLSLMHDLAISIHQHAKTLSAPRDTGVTTTDLHTKPLPSAPAQRGTT